jgi:hypothetical protein
LAGVLGNHVHERRHGVGISLDVQLGIAGRADYQRREKQQEDEDALAQDEGDDAGHDNFPRSVAVQAEARRSVIMKPSLRSRPDR